MSEDIERGRDIAHVGPIELYVTELEPSVRFYVDQLGLSEVERTDDRAYLRTWDDYGAITLTLIKGTRPGVGRTFMRAAGPNALRRRVAAIEAHGIGEGWTEDVPGQGPHVPLPRRRRPPHGHLLGARVASTGSRGGTGAEEPGREVPGARRQRPAP